LLRFCFQSYFWLTPKECSFFLISIETETKAIATSREEFYGSKKAGWYDPATPTATLRVAVGFFYCVKKAAFRLLSQQIRRMNRRI